MYLAGNEYNAASVIIELDKLAQSAAHHGADAVAGASYTAIACARDWVHGNRDAWIRCKLAINGIEECIRGFVPDTIVDKPALTDRDSDAQHDTDADGNDIDVAYGTPSHDEGSGHYAKSPSQITLVKTATTEPSHRIHTCDTASVARRRPMPDTDVKTDATDATHTLTLGRLLRTLRSGDTIRAPILIDTVAASNEGQSPEIGSDTWNQWTLAAGDGMSWATRQIPQYWNNVVTILAGSENPKITIGRSRRCDIRIKCDSVSKLHCTVESDITMLGPEPVYILTDLDSRNGTYLNGRRLKPGVAYRMPSGAAVELGDAEFLFVSWSTLHAIANRLWRL